MKIIFNEKMKYEIYCVIISILTILAWQFSFSVFSTMGIILSIITLLITRDIKYIIPTIFLIIFGYGNGYGINTIPIPIIITSSILLILCTIFTIYNFKKIRFSWHIIIYGILLTLSIIPIFWNRLIINDYLVLYFIYFTYLLYLFIFIIFKANMKPNGFRYVIIALTYLGLIMGFEISIGYINSIIETKEFTLGMNDLIGWGNINEAGILICFTLPFIYIRLINSKSNKELLLMIIYILFMIISIILTASRGTLLFGTIELVILSIFAYKYGKNKKIIKNTLIGVICVILSLVVIFSKNIIDNTFRFGFSDNGRVELWQTALNIYSKNTFTMLFGNGIVNKISVGFSQLTESGYDYIYLVYHSTIFQTLAAFGIVGLIVVAIDIILKYYDINRLDNSVKNLLLVGFIIVDIYGLIDNTYGMFYYMIPLCIVISSIEHEAIIDYKREIILK